MSTSPHTDGEDPTISVPPTEMIHMSYEGNFQLDCDAKVLSASKKVSDGNVTVDITLDRTTMYPQGGGQPSDLGILSSPDTAMNVTKVTLDRESGIVTHSGVLTGDVCFAIGQEVRVAVNANMRRLHSECHTAGHVVDAAMARCNRILPAIKAYHFLDGPYVEYRGSVPTDEQGRLVKDLQKAFGELVEEDILTEIHTMSRSEAEDVCNRDSVDFSEYSENAEIRIVKVGGWSCPCGGTHVRSTADLKERKWNVIGMKSKKGVVRVKYGQNVE